MAGWGIVAPSDATQCDERVTNEAKYVDFIVAAEIRLAADAKRAWRERQALDVFGRPYWIRTSDQRIKSPLLYQLS